MAPILDDGEQCSLEELTSLLDRLVAKLVAREVRRLARWYQLRIVVLSLSTATFVAGELLEHTWIFSSSTPTCPDDRMFAFCL